MSAVKQYMFEFVYKKDFYFFSLSPFGCDFPSFVLVIISTTFYFLFKTILSALFLYLSFCVPSNGSYKYKNKQL